MYVHVELATLNSSLTSEQAKTQLRDITKEVHNTYYITFPFLSDQQKCLSLYTYIVYGSVCMH